MGALSDVQAKDMQKSPEGQSKDEDHPIAKGDHLLLISSSNSSSWVNPPFCHVADKEIERKDKETQELSGESKRK